MEEMPPDQLTQLILQVRRDYESMRPGVRCKDVVRLKISGKRERVYTLYEFVNDATGEHHHYNLRIETFSLKKDIWSVIPPKSVTLTGETPDELAALAGLLAVARGDTLPPRSGSFLVVPKERGLDGTALRELIAAASSGEQTGLLIDLIGQVRRNPNLLNDLTRRERESPVDFEKMAVVLNYARYSNALDELKRLMEVSENEQDFQAHLAQNSWMFGSEYSERLERRRFVRDSDFDHVMRNTADGFLELIEIKTPMNGRNIFNEDASHACHFPSAPLSKVIGQVLHYLDELEQGRTAIKARDCEDVNKIRAKIVIGREGVGCPQRARSPV